ncbi:polysaccharide pyruvyl transferase family protein [Vibrio parahaemolyticus]|nr:polysaccharide pyruvyl transferase family protein [Vibrio parahaemolyticus]HCH6155711.1 polysaccharide pyruvyl transferase family protein [Vibrio parahaemolyticus]
MWSHIAFIQRLKELLPDWLKFLLIRCIYQTQILLSKFSKKELNINDKTRKKVFVLLSTDYSNLGDHALTYAHIKYIEKILPNSEIIEILVSDTLDYLGSIKKEILPGDIITLKGGGNIGVEYYREELYRRKIINSFKENKIIIFPQTIYFKDSSFSNKEKRKTFQVFEENKNVYVCTRDENSYCQIEPIIKQRAIFTPDIVFSLGMLDLPSIREGVVTAFRDDVEGIFTKTEIDKMLSKLNSDFKKVTVSDTTTNYPISIDMRENELFKIWNVFSSAELIVTDRLHGMIFAYITKTPCIVLKTYNHKVTGQYKWLENEPNIFLVDDLDKFDNSISAFSTLKAEYSHTSKLLNNFKSLEAILVS